MENENQKPPSKGKIVPCPLCNGEKIDGFAVCSTCKLRLAKERAKLALTGELVPTYEEQLISAITERLPELKKTLEEAREKYRQCREHQDKEIDQILAERLKGVTLDSDARREAVTMVREDEGKRIWAHVGGNKAVYNLRTTEERLKGAERILTDLKAKETSPKTGSIIEVAGKVVEKYSKTRNSRSNHAGKGAFLRQDNSGVDDPDND